MSRKNKLVSIGVSLIAVLTLLTVYFHSHPLAVLAPKGIIATRERNLMVLSMGLMLVVVIPVFIMTFVIVTKYRVDKQATYTPDWDSHRGFEALWWGIPMLIIAVLGVVTWQSSHALDPARALASTKKPLVVQVIALQYKWLFIYPEEQVASLNYLPIPAGRPISFTITSDAPMNSFWIPQLGGQVYAMSGMSMPLQLMADKPGDFRGVSANLSGAGFAGMNFTAHASSDKDFQQWVKTSRLSPHKLTRASYNALTIPSSDVAPLSYHVTERGIYNAAVLKYLEPVSSSSSEGTTNYEF